MTRGRRPDASLEPSRQLLTQRAFRQRRAAHLAELEEKVARLERENAALKGEPYTVEAVDAKTKALGRSAKRVKLEGVASRGGEGDEGDGGDYIDDDGDMGTPSPCTSCGCMPDKDRADVMRAVTAVDDSLSSLVDSVHVLRQALYGPHEHGVKAGGPPSLSPANGTHPRYTSHTSSAVSPTHPASAHFASQSQTYLPVAMDMHAASRYPSSSSASSPSSLIMAHPSPIRTSSYEPPVEYIKRRPVNGIYASSTPSSHPQGRPRQQPVSHSLTGAATAAAARYAGSNVVSAAPNGCSPSSSTSIGGCCPPNNGGSQGRAPHANVEPRPHEMAGAHMHINGAFQPPPLSYYPPPFQPQQLRSLHHEAEQHGGEPGMQSQPVGAPAPVGADAECCLGFFDCDNQGNIVMPADTSS